MTAKICSADVSLGNTRGLARSALWSILYCKRSLLFRESSLMPKMPGRPLPWQEMNKALHLTAAVHEMQLFPAAAGLYVTVLQKHQRCLLSDSWSTGKHLVIKREEGKCFLNVTTCSLIAGMSGCCCRAAPFHRGKQKMKVTQAGCQNLPGWQRAVLRFEQQGAVCFAVYWKWKEASASETRQRKIKC